MTNWESGRFTAEDVGWALGQLRASTKIVGGDICGAFSPPKYARAKQRFIARIDHPKLPMPEPGEATKINGATIAKLWPALTDRDEDHAGGDQE